MLQGHLPILMTSKSQYIVYYIQSDISVTTTTTANLHVHIKHILGFFMENK